MKSLFYITLISFTAFLFSQRLDLKFEHFSIENGLSSNTVNDICMDERGFIWFATEDGINRYDGYSFKVYRQIADDTVLLNNNKVYTFFTDSLGRFLVGTANGLNIYNPDFDQFESLLRGYDITAIISCSNNKYLVSTSTGLLELDQDFQMVRKIDNELSATLHKVFQDSKGRIWLVNDHAGVSLLKEDFSFEHFTKENGKISAKICNDIFETSKGTLLVGSYDEGLLYFDEVFQQFLRVPIASGYESTSPQKIFRIYEDEDQNIWVGTDGAGLGLYDEVQKRFYTYTNSLVASRDISDNVVKSMFSDRRGGFWVGTYHRGVNFVNKFSNNFKHREYIPAYDNINIVSSFLKDEKANLWLATDGGGIVYYDIQNRNTQFFEFDANDPNSLSSNNVMDLETDSIGRLWIATYYGGLSIYDQNSKKFKRYYFDSNDSTSIPSNVIWDVYKDRQNRMWVCTWDGLAMYDAANDGFIRYDNTNTNFPSNYIRSILQVSEDQYYLATSKGLLLFDVSSSSAEVFNHRAGDQTSIGEDFVLNVTKDNLGRIWVGTYGGGFYLFNERDKSFKGWKVSDGLSNNYICGIIPDKFNTLWITTQAGLSNFDPVKEEFKNFYYQDGIQNDMFSINAVARWNEDKILVGGINGYNSFIPESINKNSYPPKIQFTDFQLYDESIDFTRKKAVIDKHVSLLEEVNLGYKENMITIQFAALNYIQSEDNMVSYYMENLDKGWSRPTHTDHATYTNMSPGEYVFHLKASNNHGVWNPSEKSIRIVIDPPYWQTGWFKLLVLLVIVLATYKMVQFRLKSIIDQKKTLEKEVANRTEEIKLKNTLLEDKEERMLQSLRYAKLIQDAILPSRNEIEEDLKEMFVLFKPFEIVSGDFYWYHKVANKIIVAAIDCTGHGVPGAFMSMMGNVLLSKIVQQDGILSPSSILEELHKAVQRALHQQKTHNTDGMDMSIVVIDKSAAEMTYAGAMNPLVYFQGGAMQYIRGTRRGIGGIGSGIEKPFLEHKIPLLEETTFYLFSDGYQDQFGANGKKFMSKKFKNLLAEIHELPLRDQKEELQKCHAEWRDGERVEQTDDVLIIGCRV